MLPGTSADASVHADSSASRAEPPPARRLRRLLGASVLLLLLVGLLWKALGGRPSTVPLGIAGLGLGMSLERAREVLPGLDEIPPDGPGAVDPGSQLPRLRGRTSLFEEPATCTLWFAVEHTLSKIECAIDPLSNKQSQTRTARRILVTLQELYGPERNSGGDGSYHSWQNQRATLALRLPAEEGSIVLANTSSRHDAAVTELLAAVKTDEQRNRMVEERDALARRLEELKRLRERERQQNADAAP